VQSDVITSHQQLMGICLFISGLNRVITCQRMHTNNPCKRAPAAAIAANELWVSTAVFTKYLPALRTATVLPFVAEPTALLPLGQGHGPGFAVIWSTAM
jgi:hypothetical protein